MRDPVPSRVVGPGLRPGLASLLLVLAAACEDAPNGPSVPEPSPGLGRIERVDIVSAPASGDTWLAGEELAFAVWLSSGEQVTVSGEVFLLFEMGLATDPAALTSSDGDYLEFRYTIRRGDYDGDGLSVPAGELAVSAGGSLRVGERDLDRAVPARPADGAHRVFARFAPGETLGVDDASGRFPLDPGLAGPVGCAAFEDFVFLVEAVLDGNLAAAENRYATARGLGQCGELLVGHEAIFLTARIGEHRETVYDLALAYAPAGTAGGTVTANWWTLADFLHE